MKYVIRVAPILVALALFVSFLAIQQPNVVKAVSATVKLLDGTTSNAVSFSTRNKIIVVEVFDLDENTPGVIDTITVKLTSDAGTTTFDTFLLTETGSDTGRFRNEIKLAAATDAGASPLELAVDHGDTVKIAYTDLDPGLGRSASLTVDLNGPGFSKLSPADGTVDNEETQTITIEIRDETSSVVEDSIMFLISDTQQSQAATEALGATITEIPADSTTGIENAAGDVIGFTAKMAVDIVNTTKFIGASAVDEAGNQAWFDVDDDDAAETLAKITVDSVDPVMGANAAFTGLLFDENATDCDVDPCVLDKNERAWIMVFFDDVNDLAGNSIDAGDFSVEGHSVNAAKWFDEDGSATHSGASGAPWNIRNLVFIQLDDELAADETPDVFLGALAGGVQDAAGNIKASGEDEAEDQIGPKFVVSNFVPAPSSASLAGDDVEVTFTVTTDEEMDGNPDVTVWNVFSPGTGSSIGNTVSDAGTNRWSVVIDEVANDVTTIYNIHISGDDLNSNSADLGIDNVDVADPANIRSDNATLDEADGIVDGFFETLTDSGDFISSISTTTDFDFSAADIDEDAIYFEGDTKDLAAPVTVPAEDGSSDIRSPFFVSLDFGAEGSEFEQDDHAKVDLLSATLDGVDVLASASSADDKKWLIAILDIALGDHELVINASDQAGNELADSEFKLAFEVTERAPIEVGLNPGWNLISLPGQPADPSIDAVMANNDATAVITYDPTIPGGFLVAVRDVGGSFAGTLKTMDATRGYWVLTDSFQPIEVDVPPLAAGSAGVLPPTVPVAKGWNLVPVQDPTGVFKSGDLLQARDYFTSAEDVSAVYFFDTIANVWVFVDITDDSVDDTGPSPVYTGTTVEIGRAYWVFSTGAGSLVPVPISAVLTTG